MNTLPKAPTDNSLFENRSRHEIPSDPEYKEKTARFGKFAHFIDLSEVKAQVAPEHLACLEEIESKMKDILCHSQTIERFTRSTQNRGIFAVSDAVDLLLRNFKMTLIDAPISDAVLVKVYNTLLQQSAEVFRAAGFHIALGSSVGSSRKFDMILHARRKAAEQ